MSKERTPGLFATFLLIFLECWIVLLVLWLNSSRMTLIHRTDNPYAPLWMIIGSEGFSFVLFAFSSQLRWGGSDSWILKKSDRIEEVFSQIELRSWLASGWNPSCAALFLKSWKVWRSFANWASSSSDIFGISKRLFKPNGHSLLEKQMQYQFSLQIYFFNF